MPSSLTRTRPLVLCLFTLAVFAGCGNSAPPAPNSAPEEVIPPVEVATAPAVMKATPAPGPTPAPAEPAPTPSEDWLIVPGERVGKITATSTEADLIAAYGAENVSDEEFFFGEGESEMGTGLFAEDPTRALTISWKDPESKTRPISIQLGGTKSVWKTAEGISLGTPLTKVREINGKPFKLYGFEWDYGGSLSEGNNGNIKGLPHEDPEKGFQPVFFGLTFQHDFDAKPDYPQEKYGEVLGDTEFSSDHPVMQDMDPVVYSITVSFSEATE